MATWTATNIIRTKTEFDVFVDKKPTGNKAVNYGFTSDVMRDGVKHHEYNEPNVGVPRGQTLDGYIAQIIESHLIFWRYSESVPDTEALPDVVINLKPPPEPEPQDSIDLKAFNLAVSTYRSLVAAQASAGKLGVVLPKDIDDQIAAAKTAISDGLTAHPEYAKFLGQL